MFEDTPIATLILVLQKNKESTDILFKDIENNLERTVTLEEIKDNAFNLSVGTYVEDKSKKREVVDIFELTKKIYFYSITSILTGLKADKYVVEEFEKKDKRYMKIYNKYINLILSKIRRLKFEDEEIEQGKEIIEDVKGLEKIEEMLNDIIDGKIQIKEKR